MVLILLFLSACTPWWQVRPHTDFVKAEIQAGDQLRVETRDGEHSKFVVVQVEDDRIIGQDQTILLQDIVLLEKQSKNSPANPCSPHKPLGCSVPQWALLLHESQAQYEKFFYPSCEQHDYCYRHGAATYGMSRINCDTEFLRDMQEQCSPRNLMKILLNFETYSIECNAVAMEFYQAVQTYGVNRFSSINSTYCEYDGPP